MPFLCDAAPCLAYQYESAPSISSSFLPASRRSAWVEVSFFALGASKSDSSESAAESTASYTSTDPFYLRFALPIGKTWILRPALHMDMVNTDQHGSLAFGKVWPSGIEWGGYLSLAQVEHYTGSGADKVGYEETDIEVGPYTEFHVSLRHIATMENQLRVVYLGRYNDATNGGATAVVQDEQGIKVAYKATFAFASRDNFQFTPQAELYVENYKNSARLKEATTNFGVDAYPISVRYLF